MTFINIFRSISGERVFSSFDYVDIARGKAIQSFFAGAVNSGSTPTYTYVLQDKQFFSEDLYVANGVQSDSNFIVRSTTNFDMDFGVPRTISGKALCSMSIGYSGSAMATQGMYLIIYIKKVSGTTTTLDYAKTRTTTGASPKTNVESVMLTLPKTNFKSGDILRLTVELYAYNSDSVNTDFAYGIDPKNRTGAYISTATSVLELQLPFVIDL